MTKAQKIAQLKRLIGITHQHGLKLKLEIAQLQAKHSLVKVRVLKVRLLYLEALNRRRRRQLAALEGHPLPQPPPPKPKRFTMYDAVTLGNIPHNAEAVAAYNDGDFSDYDQALKLFPHAKVASITVTAARDGHILDVENGDATPQQAPVWVRRQHVRGLKMPIVYIELSRLGELFTAMARAGIHRSEYLVWCAHYTDIPHIEAGCDATQYSGGVTAPYDISLCEGYFLP